MSRAANGKLLFPEFIPDLPATDSPGLVEAKNCVPTDKFYRAYYPIYGSGTALSARPRGGLSVLDSAGNSFLYVGTSATLQVRNGTGWTDKSGAAYTTAANDYWRFIQFGSQCIATNYADVPQAITSGGGGNFAALATVGTAPKARQAGVVGQFVVFGDTNEATNGVVPYRLQWSRIGVASEWPVVGSADALAKQSGEQFLNSALGAVRGIFGNDQFGIVFQHNGVTRMTYVGGNIVFQFDVIDSSRGMEYPNAAVQIGDSVFFIAEDGFYFTDGVTVTPFGSGKFDRYFTESIDTAYKDRVYGGIDKKNNLIYWIYPSSSSTAGRPNRVIAYNYRENRIARAEDEIECLITGLSTGTTLDALDSLFGSLDDVTPPLDDAYWQGGNDVLLGFDSTYKLGTFFGTPGTATIETQEVELNPGMYTDISGVKPIVQGNSSVTVAIGTRNTAADTVTYTGEVTPTTRTGVADFRSCARLVRSRVKVAGDFTAAQGLMFQQQPSGVA